DCQEFIKRVNARTQEGGWKYRLPTSAEWEYACRGGPSQDKEGSSFDFYLDRPTNTLPPGEVNFKETGLQRTRKVGSRRPNRLGLYDMHGNVFEFCDDIVSEEGKSLRVLRGGSWMDDARFCGC